MLGGRSDLPWVAQFNKQMASYSDDGGKTQPAAYGHRWRAHFGHDQLATLAEELKKNPGTRRAVLGMWDPWYIHTYDYGEGPVHHLGDLEKAVGGSSDVPCNTQCYFTAREGKLHMAVTCRSNDALWGAHGANAVHFSILLEYLAAKTGLEVGEMTQFSWNYHLYDGVLKYPVDEVIEDLDKTDYYDHLKVIESVQPTPIFHADTMEAFDSELPVFLDYAKPLPDVYRARRGRPPALEHPFLKGTALPMLEAWDTYKHSDLRLAVSVTRDIKGADWKRACNDWMLRRYNALHAKYAAGEE
jgi:thymidylate synthase